MIQIRLPLVMKPYRLVTLLIVAIAALLVVAHWMRREPPEPRPVGDSEVRLEVGDLDHRGFRVDRSQTPAGADPLESLGLASLLNEPGGTIEEDLRELDGLFSVWQTNFLGEGNPWGDNMEITAALTGANRLRLAFIAPDHRAIDEQGRLCDRWGTPFFFHQLDGFRMEIISAGPDGRRGTADDRRLSPPSVE